MNVGRISLIPRMAKLILKVEYLYGLCNFLHMLPDGSLPVDGRCFSPLGVGADPVLDADWQLAGAATLGTALGCRAFTDVLAGFQGRNRLVVLWRT